MFFKKKLRNKKGVVFIISGTFILAGLLYLMMVFLDFFNLIYTETILQGDVRASALQGANYVDYDYVDSPTSAGYQGNYIIMLSEHQGNAPTKDESAEYNAQALFHYNWREHYKIAKDVNKNSFSPDSNFVRKTTNAAVATNPKAKLKVKVYNLTPTGPGTYNSKPETIDSSVSGYVHDEPGVAVYAEVPIKSWTPFFKGYIIKGYSYASPALTFK